jgi:hypothetical protein
MSKIQSMINRKERLYSFGFWTLDINSNCFFMKGNFTFLLALAFCFFGCHSNNPNASLQKTDTGANKPIVINPANNIPEYRKEIKKEAVDAYSEKTDNPLNDWYFSVRLFETGKTFQYLIKMKFEELVAEDTLRLPNFGAQPKPVLKKGKEKYSCIIGFMDTDNTFREYKLVHVENGNLKLTTLKHYSIATYQDEQ